MTIAEMARQLNVSRNTLYRRLKDSGVDITQLRDSEGQLTQYGINAIAGLFDGVTGDATEDATTQVTGGVSDTQKKPVCDTGDALNVSQLEKQVARLQERCDSLTRENDMLRAALEDMRQERDKAQRLQEREQELFMVALQRLPEPQQQPEQQRPEPQQEPEQQQQPQPETKQRRGAGWFARLFGRK